MKLPASALIVHMLQSQCKRAYHTCKCLTSPKEEWDTEEGGYLMCLHWEEEQIKESCDPLIFSLGHDCRLGLGTKQEACMYK